MSVETLSEGSAIVIVFFVQFSQKGVQDLCCGYLAVEVKGRFATFNNRNSIPNGRTVGRLVHKLIISNNSRYINLFGLLSVD